MALLFLLPSDIFILVKMGNSTLGQNDSGNIKCVQSLNLSFIVFSQISFFCGMDPECNIFGSKEGLELAKSNVEKYYAVVGVLEKWQETLQVLEEYVPMFFRNVRKVHKDNLREMVKNANTIKPKIPQAIKDKVAKNFTAEIDFYEFCKQRLYKQYLAIK